MSYDSRALANFLLDYAEEGGVCVTTMALIKVIYYAHGWHLARYDRPLSKQPFEAWRHGPVIRVVWEAFKGGGSAPIVTRAQRFDPVANERCIVPYNIDKDDASFLTQIFDAYGHIHALELSDMTHRSGSPWDRVWNAPEGRVILGMKISDSVIRDYFLKFESSRIAN